MIVEDGTGLTNANSYVSTTVADSYFSARSVTAWSDKSTAEKEVYLIKATDYIDVAFKWRGIKSTQEQSLNFPRTKLIDDNGYTVSGVPTALQDAVCECALLILNGTSMFKKQNDKGDVTSEHIGQLSFTYDVTNKIKDSSVYDAITLRLRGLYIDTNKGKVITGKVARA